MILSPRKHLYATNIIIFVFIIILQKCITIFCIIEEKACKNKRCPKEQSCNERCVAVASSAASASASSSASLNGSLRAAKKQTQTQRQRHFTLVPTSMRKAMRNFGFGEGHYQMFVEEKQRYQPTSEARLNAADAEVKLNPN